MLGVDREKIDIQTKYASIARPFFMLCKPNELTGVDLGSKNLCFHFRNIQKITAYIIIV